MLKSSGLIILAYALFILQLARLIWLKDYDQSLLIDFQELALLTKFTFLFFLGQETYSLVWLSRKDKYFSVQTVIRLIIIGVIIQSIFMALIGFKYSINYSKYIIYLLATLIWTITRNALRLRNLHIQIYLVDIFLALIIWISIFITNRIDVSLNIAGILLLIIGLYYLIKNLNKEKNQLDLITSNGVFLIVASSFTNIIQQGLLLVTKSEYSIEEWSDLSFELSLVNGVWMAVGVIIWKIQTQLWSRSREGIYKAQRIFVISSLIFTLISFGAIYLLGRFTPYTFEGRVYILLLIFLPINSITPIQSYLVSRERYWRIILAIIVSVLIILVFVKLLSDIVIAFFIGSLLYSLILAWGFYEKE